MIVSIVVAMVLGWVIGYERYYNGRIAGTQIYCLVCMTACAATAVGGHPGLLRPTVFEHDPTGMVGSVITGIGFLGAGILVRTGTSVRGLTTAASIWGTAAIGILVGINLVVQACGLTVLFVFCMALLPKLERHLPARTVLLASVRYREGHHPQTEQVTHYLIERGMRILPESLSVHFEDGCFEMEFLVTGSPRDATRSIESIAEELPRLDYVQRFTVTHSSRA